VSDVLVDSSVWIDFFRGEANTRARVDGLLAEDRVAIAGVVWAEVLSGARDRPVYLRLARSLSALRMLAEPTDIWNRVAEARFALARGGTQAAVTDLWIAIVAAASGHALLTRDRDFERIRTVVPLDLAYF
jgi:predicted nucleic acid-binding protein